MGLHTGAAEFRDGDYFGPALNRAARLMAAGHGGQVLLSEATQELCRDSLPPSTSLVNLGEHRLKDLARPETIYQAQHPDLLSAFPPLKTLDNPDLPNNLPQQVTSFIGRQKEAGEVRALLAKTRLLTLTGTGGSGKTRLALQVAADVLEQYPDGVWLIELAPLSDPALVPQTVALALGLQEQNGRTIEQVLTENLKTRRLLLLIDNAEHVLSATASLVSSLLRSCPQVVVLATSREPLGIGGETSYRVPSLSLPSAKLTATATAEYLNQFEAVRLFIERAQSVKPDFTVTNQSAPSLAQLCDRLDGMPLTIELAAARVRSMSVEDVNNRLDSRFRLLTGGDRAALPRQQTLRALVDWSYDLLTDSEKTVLARLSVFAGGWTLEAAETVCGFDPIEDWEVLDLLTSLTDKSLTHAEGSEQSTRYRMLETIRQYAAEKLAGNGDTATVRDRHRDWCIALAEEAEPELQRADQANWLNRLETEHDNFRAALDWCAEAAGSDNGAEVAGLRLASALSEFWLVRGYLNEGRERLAQALVSARQQPVDLKRLPLWKAAAKAMFAEAQLASQLIDFDTQRSLYEESIALFRIVGDRQELAKALNAAGDTRYYARDDRAAARAMMEEALAIRREIDDKRGIAESLRRLGGAARSEYDFATAQTLFEESLAVGRESGDKQSIADALGSLGNLASYQGDTSSACAQHQEALALVRSLGAKQSIVRHLGNLGWIVAMRGDLSAAQTLIDESLAIRRELGDKQGSAADVAALGAFALIQDDFPVGRSLLQESLAISRKIGDKSAISNYLRTLASIACEEGDFVGARALLNESLDILKDLGHELQIADLLVELGEISRLEADYEGARARHEEALVIVRASDRKLSIANALRELGKVACDTGNYQLSRSLHRESLVVARAAGDRWQTRASLEALARTLIRDGDVRSGIALIGIADALRENLGTHLFPRERAALNACLTQGRAALGDAAFADAWYSSRTLSWEQAVEFALGETRSGV